MIKFNKKNSKDAVGGSVTFDSDNIGNRHTNNNGILHDLLNNNRIS